MENGYNLPEETAQHDEALRQAYNDGLHQGWKEGRDALIALQQAYDRLEERLRHLLQSKTISLFDEVDPRTQKHRRDIRKLDTYGVDLSVLANERRRWHTPESHIPNAEREAIGLPPIGARSTLVWVGLDLAKGEDFTIKVTPGKDGYRAECITIDETAPKEDGNV